MPSLQRLHGSNPRRHLMEPISMRNITRASQLIPGTPLVQHPCSLRHPPRGKLPKFQLRTQLARPVVPTRQGTSLRGHFRNSPPSQNPFFFHIYSNLSWKNDNPELVNCWIIMKFEYEVRNLLLHTSTVGIFNLMFVVEAMPLTLSFLFSHIHPNISQ